MSRRPAVGADHLRARELAALVLDEPLAAADAVWLETHLDACGDCRAVAAEYADGRNALRSLRASSMEAPRDLWARTASKIEAEASRHPRQNPQPRRTIGGRLPLGAFAPLAAMLVVAVAVGAGLLNGTPLLPQGTAGMPTPIAITAAADVQVISRSDDGSMQILSRPVNAVCPVGSSECGLTRTFAVTSVGGVGAGSLNAVMSPLRDRLVVVASSNGTQGVFVLPVWFPTPAPSAPGTPGTAGTPGASPSPGTPGTSGTPAASSGSPTQIPASPVVIATGAPAHGSTSPDGTGAPSGTPDPLASPASSPSIPVSPATGGVLEIASNVVVVGPAAYSPDGTRVAFSARPSDGSAGPDVYLWTSGEAVARALTSDHGARFASWTTAGILVSRVAGGVAATTLLDPATGAETPVAIGDAWLPVVDPTGTTGAWWDGTLKRDAAGDWVPDHGSLVVGPWPAGAGAGSVPPAPAPTPISSGSEPAPSTGAGSPAASGSSAGPATATPLATEAPTATAAPATAAAPSSTAKPSHGSATTAPDATAGASPGASAGASADASPVASDVPADILALTHGGLVAWAVRWDETGTAMAVWTLGTDAPGSIDGAAASGTPGPPASGVPVSTASATSTLRAAPDLTPTNVDVVPARSGAPSATEEPAGSLPAGSLPAETATGSPSPTPAGRLSLYRVSPGTRLADLEHPMLDGVPADGGFSLRTGRVAWTSRSATGELVLQVLAWSGDTMGRIELPAAMGAMIVP